VATEGKAYHYGSIGMPVKDWGPWRLDGGDARHHPLKSLKAAVRACCARIGGARHPRHFTLFATDKKKRRIKIICRYQQYEAANKIVQRVLAGQPEEGPDLALPGLGQVAADGVRRAEAAHAADLKNPTVLIVVDRIDLDAQISRHLPRGRHPQPGEGRDAARSCSSC
jgi:type I restriction enzyme R subunit